MRLNDRTLGTLIKEVLVIDGPRILWTQIMLPETSGARRILGIISA